VLKIQNFDWVIGRRRKKERIMEMPRASRKVE